MSVLLFPVPARADSEFGLAFKGGVSAATHAAEFRANRYGFSGGLGGGLQWELDGFLLGAQIDLLYTPRGSNVVVDGERQATFKEPYFDLALAARPGVRLGQIDIYALLGGGLNLLLSARRENATGSSEDLTDNLRRFDVALLVGAGVALHLPGRGSGPFRLGTAFLEARHDHGLLDVDTMNGGLKNRSSSVMLGLSFALGSPVTNPVEPPPSH